MARQKKNEVGAKVKMLSFYILAEAMTLEYIQFFEAGLLHNAMVTESACMFPVIWLKSLLAEFVWSVGKPYLGRDITCSGIFIYEVCYASNINS